jgi:hypothetical protein
MDIYAGLASLDDRPLLAEDPLVPRIALPLVFGASALLWFALWKLLVASIQALGWL